MESQSFNVGIRRCNKCNFHMYIIYPEIGIVNSIEYWNNMNNYLDKYVESCGWLVNFPENEYLCAKCAKKIN